MTGRSPVQRLRHASLQAQATIMLVSVASVSVLLTASMITLAVRVAIADHVSRQVMDAAVTGVGMVTAVIGLCTVVACAGAATYLRSSIRSVLHPIRSAAGIVADGEFAHRINSDRTDELGVLAREIDDMAAQLARLEQSRRTMIASVSHELRTPLTVIRGHAYTLGRRETDPRRQQTFSLIDRECERLADMVSQLLEASSMQARGAQISCAATDVFDMLNVVIDRFQRIAREQNVTLEITGDIALGHTPGTVWCDALRMQQVFDNLMSNAIRHSPAGGIVTLRAESGRGGDVVIAVHDTGSGIPDSVRDVIFEPFVQGSDRVGSVGLGLAIAQAIIRAHGSSLTVDSHSGSTLFKFELPNIGEPHATTNVHELTGCTA